MHTDIVKLINSPDPKILTWDFPAGVKYFSLDYLTLDLKLSPLQLGSLQNLKPDLPVHSHPVTHDYDSFTLVRSVRKQRDLLYLVEHPALPHRGQMWRKIAEAPDRWITDNRGLRYAVEHKAARDIVMHRTLSELGLGIVTEFYGHVSETGRGLIGSIYQYVEGTRSLRELHESGYKLTEADMQAVQAVVKKLHNNGFCHGNPQRHNVFRRPEDED